MWDQNKKNTLVIAVSLDPDNIELLKERLNEIYLFVKYQSDVLKKLNTPIVHLNCVDEHWDVQVVESEPYIADVVAYLSMRD